MYKHKSICFQRVLAEAVHQRCSMKKGVLRNLAKFTGKHLCQRFFFNKVAGQACNFIKKESLAQVFSCEFCQISKNNFLTEHLRYWLLYWFCLCAIIWILFIQFVIFNPWKVLWNWIGFFSKIYCYITWLHATVDDLQTRPLRQILFFLQNNGLTV